MDWQPIETAPKDGTWFLAYVPDLDCMCWGPYEFCAWEVDSWVNVGGNVTRSGPGYWCTTDTSEPCEPTHWMPLPKSPAKTPAFPPPSHAT